MGKLKGARALTTLFVWKWKQTVQSRESTPGGWHDGVGAGGHCGARNAMSLNRWLGGGSQKHLVISPCFLNIRRGGYFIPHAPVLCQVGYSPN